MKSINSNFELSAGLFLATPFTQFSFLAEDLLGQTPLII